MVPGALSGLIEAMPSLPWDTCQSRQMADPALLEEGRLYTDPSSPGHLLEEWKDSSPPLASHKDSETSRGKRRAVPTFWFKNSLTSEIDP